MSFTYAAAGAVFGMAIAVPRIVGGMHWKHLAKHAGMIHAHAPRQLARRLETAWFRDQQGSASCADDALLQWWTSGKRLGIEQVREGEEQDHDRVPISFSRPTERLLTTQPTSEVIATLAAADLLLAWGCSLSEGLSFGLTAQVVWMACAVWEIRRICALRDLEVTEAKACVLTRLLPEYAAWSYKRHGNIVPRRFRWLIWTSEPKFFPFKK